MAQCDAAGVKGSSRITLSWRPAWAGDAEWMFGKSRTRLAPGLDKGFLMDVGPPRAEHYGLRAQVDLTGASNHHSPQAVSSQEQLEGREECARWWWWMIRPAATGENGRAGRRRSRGPPRRGISAAESRGSHAGGRPLVRRADLVGLVGGIFHPADPEQHEHEPFAAAV